MLVDVQLGDVSGVSAVEEILRADPISHLFVGGDISTVRALSPGAGCIHQPFGKTDIARAIERVLGVRADC